MYLPDIVQQAKLPSPSPVILTLLDLLNHPDVTIDDIVLAMKGDAALTAKVIKSANSAFSAPRRSIDDLRDAILRIGLIPTIHIITATDVASVFYSVPMPHGIIQNLWDHNVRVACLSAVYSDFYQLGHQGRWFLAGLLHDIGRLLLLSHYPIEYGEAMTLSHHAEIQLLEAEVRTFGFSHAEIGGVLLEYWDLPEEVVQAAYHHHEPFKSRELFGSGVWVCNQIANSTQLCDFSHINDLADLLIPILISKSDKMYTVIKKAIQY
jgi:putative nucleotidyltransferase with HDIG domain